MTEVTYRGQCQYSDIYNSFIHSDHKDSSGAVDMQILYFVSTSTDSIPYQVPCLGWIRLGEDGSAWVRMVEFWDFIKEALSINQLFCNCSRVRPHGTVPLGPHRRQRNFFCAHVCIVTFKHLPQPLRRHMQSFRILGQLMPITPPCPPK